MKNWKHTILFTFHLSLFTSALSLLNTSCVETDSTLVEFVDDNQLNSPNDTVYSLVGIIGKMQQVADRSVLLGELRGDLTQLTPDAHLDLQDIANFQPGQDNPYVQARDYYAIVQNCNYFLAHADSTLTKRGEKVFLKEIAVMRTYRAWAYLQLALNYGKVPFFTQPLLTELEADPARHPQYDLKQIADFLIQDLAPYVDTPQPQYGGMNGLDSRRFFIPVRVMLGDLCLWSGRYQEAADYYHAYLTKQGDTHPTQVASVGWSDRDFADISDSYASQFSQTNPGSEFLTVIPMNEQEYDGIVSTLPDVFGSTQKNSYFYQATHSAAYSELSQAQRFTMVVRDPVTQLPDTICPPDTLVYAADNLKGDLRQQSIYKLRTEASTSTTTSNLRQTNYKYANGGRYVTLYRLSTVYLRYAEALNRLGLPQTAFAVLKYGLCPDNLIRHIGTQTVDLLPKWEREKAGDLISFSQYTFTSQNTQGIHSRGCGRADADNSYAIPACATLSDSIMAVEDLIVDEMALETASEGQRWYDLMRVSMHRDDPNYLARKVAGRAGKANFDDALFLRLQDRDNWYLPLR